MLATTFNSGHPTPISETTFRTIDGVVLAVAFLLIAMGTFTILSKPKWKLARLLQKSDSGLKIYKFNNLRRIFY